ncbi:MAG: 2-oxoacid:acceptor oxidoreductase subunit alpha [Candidatus Omnitrophica bacterium]|nr:2-oxoacid:acceptor oxidoreductase subunit alpha [Candidatus Omnitrophota bacterium]
MLNELSVKISGEAGQGTKTVGMALCNIFRRCGYHVFASQDYMSRVRGGNNFFQIRIADRPVSAPREYSEITVALDSQSVGLHNRYVSKNGIMVLDRKKFGTKEENESYFDVPMYELAEKSGNVIFLNSVACGVVAGIIGVDFSHVENELKKIFSEKQETVIIKNIEAARSGYDFAAANFSREKLKLAPLSGQGQTPFLLKGNDAIAIGAIRAGCKFYSAYPMTPSTSIMSTIAAYSREFGIVVEQAEDEIAAINMALGASFAGARSMTGTSGGGFALMVEGVSLAGMTETPVVIVEAQRPAPATGFPTRTEQADLDFVIHAGHGEFARVVYAPGSIEEAFYLTIKAFNIAERFQVPVMILTDQFLADSYRNVAGFDLDREKVARYIISREESRTITAYKRYQLNESGVSPRAIPSWIEEVIYVDSDEHTEEGHITEDAGLRMKMVEKRLYKKMAGLLAEAVKPVSHAAESAEIVLVGFGSTYGVIKEAVEALPDKIGLVHFPQVWPFPAEDAKRLLKNAKKVINVENNASGQLGKLLMRETGIPVSGSILKFDGRPFDLDYLLRSLGEIR